MTNVEVVGLGALNMDYLCHVRQIIGQGETAIEEFTLSPGGSAPNTIYGLAKLGVSTAFIGAVGDDEDGQLLLKNFQSAGVDTSPIKVKTQAKTGAVVCLRDKKGKRSLYVLSGANKLLAADDIDQKYVNQAKVLHLSAFPEVQHLEASVKLVKDMAPSVKLSFSPGSLYAARGLDSLKPILARTHILFINRREIRQLTGKDVRAGARACLDLGCQIVVVTLGKGVEIRTGKGATRRTVTAVSYIRDAGHEYVIEPSDPAIMAVFESTGAGDAFATGFIFGWLQGQDLEECGFLGDLVARFALTKTGARQGLPTRSDLISVYRQIFAEEL